MAKSFQRRFEQANNIAAGAYSTWQKAIDELEMAARLQRETFDAIQEQIDELTNLAADANRNGVRAEKNARKLREFFAE